MFPPFRPFPFLGNTHVQTIVGNLLQTGAVRLPELRRLIALADGDALVTHDTTPSRWRAGDAVAVLVHGLAGCHRSGYLVRLTNLLNAQEIRVVRVDLRGAGPGLRLARRLYNAACSPDVRVVMEAIAREALGSPLFLVGFSLGGNIVLKLAGEAAAQPLPSLRAVVAVAPPVDLSRCAQLLKGSPFYDRYFGRNLKLKVERHQRLFPELPRVRFPRSLGLVEFDNLYTAPRGGYADAEDYYRRASSLPLLPRIDVPGLIVSARDDPFIACDCLEALQSTGRLQVHIVPKGGHLGFLGWNGSSGGRWVESVVAQWIADRVKVG
jgi:predicted alpha/beta-fold hydrolase